MRLKLELPEKINTLIGKSTTSFKYVYIETVGACTNACYCCPAKGGKKKQHIMTDDTFHMIIAKLQEINFSGEVHLYGQGEPFLDKKIIERIYYAKENLPNANIVLISNFTVLNDKLIDEVLEAPLHNFSCSLYALDEINYKKIAGRDNFLLAFINQIKFLKKYAKKIPYSFAFYILNSEFIKDDMDFIQHYMFDLTPAQYLQVCEVSTFFNSIHNKLRPSKKYFSPCIYDKLKITSDGDITPCCSDAQNFLKIGNIFKLKETLNEMFNNKIAIKFRKKMLWSNDKDAFCQYCDNMRNDLFINYLISPMKIFDKNIFKHRLRCYRNSNEEIKIKSQKFNEIFKDNEIDNWYNVLQKLRMTEKL